MATTLAHTWSLEVVRGQEPGRTLAIDGPEFVVGRVNLGSQENPASPRAMEPRHALIEFTPAGLAIRDLETPGGTFVNRQRVLPGQSRKLEAGDVIQLGAVHLKVVPLPVAVAQPSTSTFAFTMAGGSTCRSWDDFLAVSAQRWTGMRDELASGRLASFLVSIGRTDLVPAASSADLDERLDTWLGRLPTTRPSRPELDVHPLRLVVRATPGGGAIRKVVRVANVGHRLLRSTARIEPNGLTWVTVVAEFGRAFTTVEETELALDFAIPETIPTPMRAELVVEGNGGTKRIAIVLEAKPAATAEPVALPESQAVGPTLGELIARQSPAARVATWSLILLAVRLLAGVAGGSIGEDAMVPSGVDSPRLGGVALAMAGVGALTFGILAARRGGWREAFPGAFAGGCGGVVLAAAMVAGCRSIEPWLGGWAASIVAVCGLWAAVGAGLAGVSLILVRKIS